MAGANSRRRRPNQAVANGMPPALEHDRVSMTLSPSELSIFDHNDEEVGDELADDVEEENDNNNNSNDAGTHPNDCTNGLTTTATTNHDDDQALSQELLDALYLGTGNFLLAYNTRAGIGVLMRVFKLLQQRNLRALVDLPQLLDEKHLAFRVDAVAMGLFLGWFTGGYRALRALLPRALTRLALWRQQQPLSDSDKHAVDQLTTLGAGAVAGCAIVFMNAKRRRSLALYALTRALQCAYNTAKRNNYWHFWGSSWAHGDALLFALSSAQVMYAFIMRPTSLPSDYFRFIQKTGPVEKEVLEIVRRHNRGLALDPDVVHSFIAKHRMKLNFPVPVGHPDMVSCRLVHHQGETCTVGVLQTFRRAFGSAFPLYLSLFIVPSVVIHFKKFLARPFRTLGYSVLNATRSNSFVASFVALYMAIICVQRRVMTKDHRFIYYLAGLGASFAIFIEPKSRRSELALYVLPRALDSLSVILRDRRIFTGMRNGEVLVFALSMACMMHTYEHETDSMGPFLKSTLKRFLQSPTDKKKIFLAHLEQQRLHHQQNKTTPAIEA